MTKLEGIKACVFDAYGTLFDVHSPVARLAASVGPKADAVSQLWRDKQLQYTWLRSLMGTHADFWIVTGEALRYALERNEVEDETLRNALMQAYMTLDAYDDVAPTLKTLRKSGLKTAILSNGTPDMLSSAVRSAGLDDLFDEVLSIERVGIYKPDRRVYQLASDSLRVEPRQICFVSTNAWDASGAAHFGFQTVWMNRFNLIPENLPGELAGTIKGLRELVAVVANG